ncbi:MAG: oligosaccharide repeat unit polymerase [Paludibacteraceae bacterium]|nr:oligosaccharide repeat unit polymerase [Paludibacteraceae bacterium]
MEVTLFVILFLLVTIGWFAYRWYKLDAFSQPLTRTGWFAPWYIHLLHWGFVLLMLGLTSASLFPVTLRLWYSLALWVPIFVIAAFFAYWPCDAAKPKPSEPGQIGRWVFYGLLAVSVVLTPLYLMAVWHNVTEMHWSGGGELIRALRDLALEEKDYGLLGWAFVINQLLYVVSLFWKQKIPWWVFALVIVLNVLTAASVMEKGYLVYLVIVAAWLLYEQGVLKMWHIGLTIVLTLVGAYFFTLIRTFAETDAQDLMSFGDFFAIYVTSPSVAYCYMPLGVETQLGNNSLFIVYHILNRLGVGSFAVMERIQPFINVPVETNTYTVMQPFFLDFGYAGLAVFAAVYGMLSGVFYRWHREGRIWGTCLYAVMLAALCTQFHQEELLSHLIQNIQYAVLALFIAL